MKITKSQLQQIIREEVSKLHEQAPPGREEAIAATPEGQKEFNKIQAGLKKAGQFANSLVAGVKDPQGKKVVTDLVLAAHDIALQLSMGGVDSRIADEWHRGVVKPITAASSLADKMKNSPRKVASKSTKDND